MINIDVVTKSYGDVTAVDRVSLNIEKGELFGLLGPNGAGKSTLIHLLTGLLSSDSGTITLMDLSLKKSPAEYKRKIGLVPQDLSFYEDLSASQNVSYFAGLYGLRGNEKSAAVDRALEITGLENCGKQRSRHFSGGMKRRLNIACGIVHQPSVIFLDEPTVGIDPQSRHHILKSVEQLRKGGCTVVYTTHYMEEAESLCTRVGIIDKGKIIALGTTAELKDLVDDSVTLCMRIKDPENLDLEKINAINGVDTAQLDESSLTVVSKTGIHNINDITAEVIRQKKIIVDIETRSPSLETVFLKLTGRTLRD